MIENLDTTQPYLNDFAGKVYTHVALLLRSANGCVSVSVTSVLPLDGMRAMHMVTTHAQWQFVSRFVFMSNSFKNSVGFSGANANAPEINLRST